MSAGASLLGLFSGSDPREELMRALMGQQQAAAGTGQAGGGADPYAAAAGAGAGTAGQQQASGAGVQAMAENPDGLKSPPDLAGLYMNLLKFNNKAANFDRGLGLIGSAVSQDGNRESTMSAFTGENAPNASAGMDGIANSILDFNKQKIAATQRAAQMASLPAIAERYGLSMATARYLMDTGKLDSVIAEAEKPNRELKELANGQVALIDKNTGSQAGVFGPEDDNRTNEQKNFEGGPDLEQWMLRQKQAGASRTENNIKLPEEEGAFAKKYGELQGEKLDKLVTAAENAGQMLDMYDLVEQGLNTDVTTGKLGETELQLRKFGQYLGLDTDATKIGGGELIKSVQNRMALLMRNPDSGMGMPGSVSDKDIQFLKESQVGIDNSPQGNRAMLEAFRRLEKRKIEVADMAEAYAEKNGTLRGFQKQLREYSEANPLFTADNFNIGNSDPAARQKALREKYGIK